MKILKKFNEFNEKISVAFQTSHSNRLGPGYNWNINQSGPITHPRLILNDFISEYGEAQLAKDESGYYLLVKINTNKQIEDLPQKYQGLRVVKRYNENFELEEEEGFKILDEYKNANDILKYLEDNFGTIEEPLKKWKDPEYPDIRYYGKQNLYRGDMIFYVIENKQIRINEKKWAELVDLLDIKYTKAEKLEEILRWYISMVTDINPTNMTIGFDQAVLNSLSWFYPGDLVQENFELDEDEGLNILEGLPNAEEIMEYLELTFNGFKPHKRTYKSDRLNDDSIYYIKDDKIGFAYDKNKKSVTVEKENYHPLIGMTSDNNSRYRAMMVLKWYLSATYNIDVEIVFELGGNNFFKPSEIKKNKNQELIPIMESFDLFDTHEVEELIMLLDYYIEVLGTDKHKLEKAPEDYQMYKHKGKMIKPNVNFDEIDFSTIPNRLYTVSKDFLESGKEIIKSGITDYCQINKLSADNYFAHFVEDLIVEIQKWSAYGTFNKEDIRYDYNDKNLGGDKNIDVFNYLSWQKIYHEVYKLKKRLKSIEDTGKVNPNDYPF